MKSGGRRAGRGGRAARRRGCRLRFARRWRLGGIGDGGRWMEEGSEVGGRG